MRDVVIGAEQAFLRQPRHAVFDVALAFAAVGVRGVDEAVLAREPDVVHRDVVLAPVGAEDRHRERDEAVVGGEAPGAQAVDFLARERDLVVRRLAFGVIGGFTVPRPNTARMPDSSSPSIAASVISASRRMWHQSMIVVAP